jgi:hypothetical protein
MMAIIVVFLPELEHVVVSPEIAQEFPVRC